MAAVANVGKQVRNVAVLLAGGKVSFVQQKMLLPFYDVFDEQRYFEAGTEQTLTCVEGQPLAITICEDAWNDKGFWPRQMYPVDPVEGLMTQWETRKKELDGTAADHFEYLGFALLAGEAAGAAEHAGGDCGAAWRVCCYGEPGGRQRQPGV